MRHVARRLIAPALCLLILAVLASRLDLALMVRSFSQVAWGWAACAALVNLLNTGIEAVRWRAIVAPIKKRASVANTFAALLVGVVGNSLLPLKLGDAARVYELARREQLPVASVVSTVILDRIVDVGALLTVIVLTSAPLGLPVAVNNTARWGLAAVATVAAVALLLAWIRRRRAAPAGVSRREGLTAQLDRFAEGFAALRRAGLLLPVGALAVCSWVARGAIVWLTLRAFGLMLPAQAAVVVLIVINVGIAAVAAPANLGAFELSAMAGLGLLGVRSELALSYGVTLHAVELVPPLLLGLTIVWRSGLTVSGQ